MGKRKQSAASWRKRGAPLEDAALHVRRQANQERRTGGSVAKLNDAQLFALDVKAGGRPAPQAGSTVEESSRSSISSPAQKLGISKLAKPAVTSGQDTERGDRTPTHLETPGRQFFSNRQSTPPTPISPGAKSASSLSPLLNRSPSGSPQGKLASKTKRPEIKRRV